MKGRKIITISIIMNLILVGMVYNLISKVNVNNKKQVIKEMTESEQVSELQTQLDNLNESHEEYARNVQSYKKKIASAITDMGVATTENDTDETIVTNIGKILQEATKDATVTEDRILKGYTAYKNGQIITGTMENGGASIYYLGEGTSFDVKAKLPNDYMNLTNDNFIVGTMSVEKKTAQKKTGNLHQYASGGFLGLNMSKSYDNSTGILTISGNSYNVWVFNDEFFSDGSSRDATVTGTVTPFVYVVVGNIQQ